jgi:hypothetical protein
VEKVAEMSKAVEIFGRTLEALKVLDVAAEEFYNEELISIEEWADKGHFECYFSNDDVPIDLRPHIESKILPIFEKNGFFIRKEKRTGLFGGDFFYYYINSRYCFASD